MRTSLAGAVLMLGLAGAEGPVAASQQRPAAEITSVKGFERFQEWAQLPVQIRRGVHQRPGQPFDSLLHGGSAHKTPPLVPGFIHRALRPAQLPEWSGR